MSSASQLTMHSQTSVEQANIPAKFRQPLLERRPENTNPIGRVCPTSGNHLQRFGCQRNEFQQVPQQEGQRPLTVRRGGFVKYFLNDLEGFCEGGPVEVNGGVSISSFPTGPSAITSEAGVGQVPCLINHIAGDLQLFLLHLNLGFFRLDQKKMVSTIASSLEKRDNQPSQRSTERLPRVCCQRSLPSNTWLPRAKVRFGFDATARCAAWD